MNFTEKKAKLQQASINLKKRFIGIDPVIDSIIKKVEGWYLFPDACLRPVIINLWGMTGVGKTDLIRCLVEELGFKDKFLEIQMGGKSSDYEGKDIERQLSSSDIEEGEAGVVLLDEMQRFRTVDEQGCEIRDYDMQDVWSLLSDGKFNFQTGVRRLQKELYMEMLQKQYFASMDEKNSGGGYSDFMKSMGMNFHTHVAEDIKSVLKRSESAEEIAKWSNEKVLQLLDEMLKDPNAPTEVDYTKLLIFVSGNLDEAFKSATDVSDVEVDADYLHRETSKVDFFIIKDALLNRLKPEQISRLGNTHIIYPTLSKESFRGIIRKRLEDLSVSYENVGESSIEIKFDESIVDLMYRNGVFPAQGVRPILSTVDDFMTTVGVPVIIHSLEKGITEVTLSEEKVMSGEVIVNSVQGDEAFEYVGEIDRLKIKTFNMDHRVQTAVHEAGHALLYMIVSGVVPDFVYLSETTQNGIGGLTSANPSMTKGNYLDEIVVGMGGMVAETILLDGLASITSTSGDIEQMTAILANAHRKFGVSSLPFVSHDTMNGADVAYSDVEKSNEAIHKDLNNAHVKARLIIRNNLSKLISLTMMILKNTKVDSDELREFARVNNIRVRDKDTLPATKKLQDKVGVYGGSTNIKEWNELSKRCSDCRCSDADGCIFKLKGLCHED